MDALRLLVTKLRKLLRHKGRSADDADDLIQEAFLRLQQYRASRHVQEPEAFLVRTVQNLAIDAIRRKARRGSNVTLDHPVRQLIDPQPLPDEVLANRQRLQRLRTGLEQLSPRTREVVMLHRLEGYSQAQIAEQLQITVSAVEKHVAKAALFLSDWMTEEEQ